MTEIEQLRADLEVLERYDKRQGTIFIRSVREEIERKIAQLEADADPWRDAKGVISLWRTEPDCFLPTTTTIVAYIDNLTAENERLKARVAELERAAKLPPVSLKRADETHVGDRILGGGKIRTISHVHGNTETSRVRLWGNGWCVWLESDELVAVVNGAMGEGETRPLKKGCDDGK